MFDPTLPSPCIVLDNEDTSLDTFLKLLIKHNKISSPQLRCRRTIPQVTLGNKIKKF